MRTGHRARLLGLNEIGLRRHGFPAEVVKALREVYRLVLRSDLSRQEALALARSDYSGIAECKRFVEFVAATRRGIARHGRE